jgi:hypothetical protein
MPYQHIECESEKGLRGGGKDKAPRVKVGRIVQPRMWRGSTTPGKAKHFALTTQNAIPIVNRTQNTYFKV